MELRTRPGWLRDHWTSDRHRGVSVSIASPTIPVLYAGPQGEVEGFDQGNVSITLTANGVAANTIQVTVK
jgi:hypothetical protein